MPVGKEELCRKRIEVRMQELLCGGNVNLAVLDAKVVSVDQQRRCRKTRNTKSRKTLSRGLVRCISCRTIQMYLFRELGPERKVSRAVRPARTKQSIKPWNR